MMSEIIDDLVKDVIHPVWNDNKKGHIRFLTYPETKAFHQNISEL